MRAIDRYLAMCPTSPLGRAFVAASTVCRLPSGNVSTPAMHRAIAFQALQSAELRRRWMARASAVERVSARRIARSEILSAKCNDRMARCTGFRLP